MADLRETRRSGRRHGTRCFPPPHSDEDSARGRSATRETGKNGVQMAQKRRQIWQLVYGKLPTPLKAALKLASQQRKSIDSKALSQPQPSGLHVGGPSSAWSYL